MSMIQKRISYKKKWSLKVVPYTVREVGCLSGLGFIKGRLLEDGLRKGGENALCQLDEAWC